MFKKKNFCNKETPLREINFKFVLRHPGDNNKSLKDVFIPTILQHSDDCAKLHMQNVRVCIYNTTIYIELRNGHLVLARGRDSKVDFIFLVVVYKSERKSF